MKGSGRGKLEPRMPLTKTTEVQYSKFDENFVPGWDSKPGAQQKTARIKPRAAMGAKKTPLFGGTLKPAR